MARGSGSGVVAGVVAGLVAFYLWGRFLTTDSKINFGPLPGEITTYMVPGIEALGIPSYQATVIFKP